MEEGDEPFRVRCRAERQRDLEQARGFPSRGFANATRTRTTNFEARDRRPAT
jgi:hypothetical protein